MLYRIRYHEESAAREREASVEANSPTEALIKFRYTRQDVDRAGMPRREITSVCAEDFTDDPVEQDALSW